MALFERDPLVPRRMRNHLSELAMLGIMSMTERNEGRRGGTYREYALDLDPDLILQAMEDTVEVVGIHESVVDMIATADSTDQSIDPTQKTTLE